MSNRWEECHFGHIKTMDTAVKEYPFFQNAGEVKRYALIVEDECVLILFFVPIAKGTEEVVLIPGENIRKYRRTVFEVMARDLENYMTLNQIVRLQANTKGDLRFHSFMSRLGFTVESLMRRYAEGEDYLMWVKFGGE